MQKWIRWNQQAQWPGALALILFLLMNGCSPSSSPTSAAKLYEFRGKVIDVSIEKRTATIQHEDIPGLMPAMTMTFRTGEAVDLAGFQVGDVVHGQLAVRGGDYVIVHLQRSKGDTRKP
jgi:protein SCO1/2